MAGPRTRASRAPVAWLACFALTRPLPCLGVECSICVWVKRVWGATKLSCFARAHDVGPCVGAVGGMGCADRCLVMFMHSVLT